MTDAAIDRLTEFELLIGGEQVAAASGATYDSVDPFTGKPWAGCPTVRPSTSTSRWQRPGPLWRGRGGS